MKEIPKGEGLFEQIRKGLPMSKEDVDEFWKKYLKNEDRINKKL